MNTGCYRVLLISGSRVLGACFPGADEHSYPIEQLPAGLLTHVFYAFATIEDGQLTLPSAAPAQLAAIKRAHPYLRIVVSIGGWGAGGFSDAALTPHTRARPAALPAGRLQSAGPFRE